MMVHLMVEMREEGTDDLLIYMLVGKMGDQKELLRDTLSRSNMMERQRDFETGHSLVTKMVLWTVALKEISLVN